MTAEELVPLRGWSSILAMAEENSSRSSEGSGFSAQEVDGCRVRWRSGFPHVRAAGTGNRLAVCTTLSVKFFIEI